VGVTYRVIAVSELDRSLLDAWGKIRSDNEVFASPYFCPEFTQLAGAVRKDVKVVVIENDGTIAGFFPYQRSLWGMGNPVGGALSDYHGVISGPEAEWEIEPLMRAAKLSVFAFSHLVGDAGKFAPYVQEISTSPQIDLSAGYKCYADGRRDAGSDYIRKTEGLARKMGREVGELRFALHEPDRETMAQLVEWKSAQYRTGRLPDAFSVPWTGDLLNRIATTSSDGFAGVCSVLRAGDRRVAIHMGIRSSNVLHYWFPAYDPAYAKFSTGIILLLRMAEALSDLGIRTIDLGEGKSQYKERLMTGEAILRKGAVELPSMLARVRKAQRMAETLAGRPSVPKAFTLPFRAIRRLERTLKYR
jgi:CelD/BcsL family acetyltransferase involved in cellulose biosynthesis